MQNKNLRLLMTIFIILTGFLVVRTYLPHLLPPPSTYMQKISLIDKASVHSLSIKNKTEMIDLKKEDNIWKINGKKADVTKIENLINQLLPTTPPELVAQTDKRHQDFEITDELATKITLDNKLTWLIGKSSGSFVYARFAGENDVYLLKDISPTSLSLVSDWHDKTILNFDASDATELVFKKPKDTIVLKKRDDKWINEVDTKEVKTDKVSSVLAQASNLTAQSLYDPQSKTKYPSSAELTFTVKYKDNSETLELYKGSSDYLVKRLSDGEQFIISEYNISSIISAPENIFD